MLYKHPKYKIDRQIFQVWSNLDKNILRMLRKINFSQEKILKKVFRYQIP